MAPSKDDQIEKQELDNKPGVGAKNRPKSSIICGLARNLGRAARYVKTGSDWVFKPTRKGVDEISGNIESGRKKLDPRHSPDDVKIAKQKAKSPIEEKKPPAKDPASGDAKKDQAAVVSDVTASTEVDPKVADSASAGELEGDLDGGLDAGLEGGLEGDLDGGLDGGLDGDIPEDLADLGGVKTEQVEEEEPKSEDK